MILKNYNVILFCVIIIACVCLSLCQAQGELNLSEGAKCIVGEKNGTCVNLYQCPSAAGFYTHAVRNPLVTLESILRTKICSYRQDGEPVVCCTDCKLDKKEPMRHKFSFVYGTLRDKRGSKSWRKCQEYFQTLPYPCQGVAVDRFSTRWVDELKCDVLLNYGFGIGGERANKWQFPHMALLGYGPDRDSAQWLCGGTVISERYILTAAHCAGSPRVGPITLAALGVLTRDEVNDYWKVYKIKRIIKHPGYQGPHKYHDIALLETDTEINFSRGLLPACLDMDHISSYSDQVEATGWGRLGHRQNLADHLMVMTLNEFNHTTCSELFPVHRHLKSGYNRATQMCYGRRDKIVDTCEGDSGGPLQSNVNQCIYRVFGVTSFGKDCGSPGNAGMYTRVSYYLPWIESIVWPDP